MFDGEGTLGEVKARRAIKDLTELGIAIPKPVRDKVIQLEALAAAEPNHPAEHRLVAAIINGHPDEITAAAIESVTFEARRTAHAQARLQVARDISAALRTHSGPVLTALTKLAEQAAENITAAKQLDGNTVDSLVLA